MAMLYKQVVLGVGPSGIHDRFRFGIIVPTYDSRASRHYHPFRLAIPTSSSDLQIYRHFIKPFQLWNCLPSAIFPPSPSLPDFKKKLNAHLRGMFE
jgi:hypothetical protein